MLLTQITNYFRSCYQYDFKAIQLLNFFSSKVENQLIIELPELLTGQLMQIPVSSEWGLEVSQKLKVYAKEKSLFMGAFFLLGSTKMLGRKQEICAPLLIYDVSLFQEEGVYYVSTNFEPTLNPAFLDNVKSHFQIDDLNYDQFNNELPKGKIGFAESSLLETYLNSLFPKLDIEALKKYPTLLDKEMIVEWRQEMKKSNHLSVVPAIGLGFIKNPVGSRGVLNELKELVEKEEFSLPLQAIFEGIPTTKNKLNHREIIAPVTLNQAQQNIITSAENHTLTMAVGPPGTGKSFTIATLAVDFLTQGKSVLIAARNSQAINVVADKIEKDFSLKEVVVRAGIRGYQQLLKNRLKSLLFGFGTKQVKYFDYFDIQLDVRSIERKLKKIAKQIEALEVEEKRKTTILLAKPKYFWQKWQRKRYIKLIKAERAFWVHYFEYVATLAERNELVKSLNQNIFDYWLAKVLNQNRGELQAFFSGLKKRQGQVREAVFKDVDFRKILQAFPIWVINTSDIDKVLPLQKEMFDLVIIDEASQCDMASAIPILQRGRRAVIVGDPKQLRHVSFLSRQQMDDLVVSNGLENYDFDKLDYRVHSLLDIVSTSINTQNQVHLLNEHYRSLPDIIAFSNQHFYHNQLQIMTETPATKAEKCVFIHHVEGKRSKRGYNQKEAEAIINKVKNIIEKEQLLPKNLVSDIGILSPFREQINYIQKKLEKQLSIDDFKRHNLLIGTPHAFQGEEKQVMLLSFVIDKDTHPSTYQYLNKEDVFNVSITRAQTFQLIYTSVVVEDLNSDYLIAQYFNYVENQNGASKKVVAQKAMFKDEFLEEVTAAIQSLGVKKVFQDYQIAGIGLDLLVLIDGKSYCIDLIGFPGVYENAISIYQLRTLSRVNIPVFMLPYSRWLVDKAYCIQQLKSFLV